MIGIQSVISLPIPYHSATLAILSLFAAYDFKHHKVCNAALLAFLPWCLFSVPMQYHISVQPADILIIKSAIGFLCGGLTLLSAAMITNGGIGGGDIKLTALLGIIYGPAGICVILFMAACSALFFSRIISPSNKSSIKRIPFVPFLFLGALLLFIY